MSQLSENISLDVKLRGFEDRCRQNGLKVTPQRVAVYKALVSTHSHPTTEEVHKVVRQEFRNISLDTVNRSLLTLAEIGVAFQVEGTGQPRRFDGGAEDHQHFRCIKCRKIIDFHYRPFDNIAMPEHLQKRFQIMRKTVYIEGLCEVCKQASSA